MAIYKDKYLIRKWQGKHATYRICASSNGTNDVNTVRKVDHILYLQNELEEYLDQRSMQEE